MATRPNSGSPWPQSTPHPHSSPSKGKRKWDPTADQPPHRHRQFPRQSPQATVNSNDCGIVANDVISCFPTANSTVVQNIDTRFVWNRALPQFSQSNLVDIYLFHGESDVLVEMWPRQPYQMGHLPVSPNDTWWGPEGADFTPGTNSTQTFFFLMVANGTNTLSGSSQATFTATQTAFPNSILSSMSSASLASASAAAASASAASLSSTSSPSSTVSSTKSSPASQSPGSLQNNSNDSNDFPHWAIALLSVFGFLAFISFLFVFWLLIRNIRSRKRAGGLTHRNSMGSQSPMMANIAPSSPVNAAPGSSLAHGEPHSVESGLAPLPVINNRHNVVSSDGASTVSRADSAGGPFSAVDAAAMAAAFRNVMRKPDFADRPMEEGESPEHKDGDVLNRELAEEGRDIRSVSSSRGVRVETLSDSGDTAH
ncbi:hypothetical protein K439DRAFT_68487 [Ramaria rubella]|nr:hypothetical protein K439DRAFT_68487 [Ramaria rubella]